jgi:hypothetical protein
LNHTALQCPHSLKNVTVCEQSLDARGSVGAAPLLIDVAEHSQTGLHYAPLRSSATLAAGLTHLQNKPPSPAVCSWTTSFCCRATDWRSAMRSHTGPLARCTGRGSTGWPCAPRCVAVPLLLLLHVPVHLSPMVCARRRRPVSALRCVLQLFVTNSSVRPAGGSLASCLRRTVRRFGTRWGSDPSCWRLQRVAFVPRCRC